MAPGSPARTAIVTGATKGIGRAVVQRLAERGTRLGCIARSERDLLELQRSLQDRGQRIEVAQADVSIRSDTEKAIDALTTTIGPVDVLVNNAGIGLHGPVVDLDPDDAERLMTVNYLGTVYATCAVLPQMAERRSGHIVNVASIAGLLGAPLEAAYSASKFAVVGFSEALSIEARAFGVRVSVVSPGPVDTGFFEARGHPYSRSSPRPISAEAVADAVLRAIDRGRFEAIVPAPLRSATLLRTLVPRLYFFATRRAFRAELSGLSELVDGRTRTESS